MPERKHTSGQESFVVWVDAQGLTRGIAGENIGNCSLSLGFLSATVGTICPDPDIAGDGTVHCCL